MPDAPPGPVVALSRAAAGGAAQQAQQPQQPQQESANDSSEIPDICDLEAADVQLDLPQSPPPGAHAL